MRKKSSNKSLIIAAIVCVIALIVMGVALFTGGNGESVQEFTPPPFEETAETGVPEVPAELGYGEIDAKVYKASICGGLILKDDKVDIYLTNPEENDVWMKVRVLDTEGNRLGETGLIKPGQYVKSVTFIEHVKAGTNVQLKIMAYEPETYHSAGAVTMNTVVGGN